MRGDVEGTAGPVASPRHRECAPFPPPAGTSAHSPRPWMSRVCGRCHAQCPGGRRRLGVMIQGNDVAAGWASECNEDGSLNEEMRGSSGSVRSIVTS